MSSETHQLKERAIRGAFWVVGQNWGGQVISFVVFAFLARLLEPEDFGLVAMAGVFLALTQIFVNQGFSHAIVQVKELEPGYLDTAFWINILLGLLCTAFGIAAAGAISALYHEPKLQRVLVYLSLSFSIYALSAVQEALLRRSMNFRVLAVRRFVSQIGGGIVGISLAFAGYGPFSLVGQQLTAAAVGVVMLWTASDWRPGLKVSLAHARYLFGFGVNMIGIQLLNFVNFRADQFLIGFFLGSTALGYYAVAQRLMGVASDMFVGIINSLALPVFSRLQADPRRLLAAFQKSTRVTHLFSFPIFMGLIAVAPEVITLLFGEQWSPSIPVARILFCGGFMYGIQNICDTIVLACGKPSWVLALNCINATSNLILYSVLVHFGIGAVALSFVLRAYLLIPLRFITVRKLMPLNMRVYAREYLSTFAVSAIMLLGVMGAKATLDFEGFPGVLLAVYIGVGVVIVAGLTFLWQRPLLLELSENLRHAFR